MTPGAPVKLAVRAANHRTGSDQITGRKTSFSGFRIREHLPIFVACFKLTRQMPWDSSPEVSKEVSKQWTTCLSRPSATFTTLNRRCADASCDGRKQHKPAAKSGVRAQQVQRLQKVFDMDGSRPKAVDCPAIDGIIKEAKEIMGDVKLEDKEVLDAAGKRLEKLVRLYAAEPCRQGEQVSDLSSERHGARVNLNRR
jgi:Domain of unknown function (DUF892)